MCKHVQGEAVNTVVHHWLQQRLQYSAPSFSFTNLLLGNHAYFAERFLPLSICLAHNPSQYIWRWFCLFTVTSTLNSFLCAKCALSYSRDIYLVEFKSENTLTLLKLMTWWFTRQDTFQVKLIVLIVLVSNVNNSVLFHKVLKQNLY